MAKLSSDDIKTTLVEKFGGTTDSWKRLGRKKNSDGNVEREFHENALSLCVIVTESKDGLSFAQSPLATAGLPVLEKDTQKIALARKTLNRIINGDDGSEEEEMDDAFPKLLAQSGETAFANQFVFAIVSADPALKDYQVFVNAAKAFKESPYHDDDTYYHVQELLPRYFDDSCGQNYFDCTQGAEPTHAASGIPPAPPPADMALLLLQQGFAWNEKYQKACEEYARSQNHFDAGKIKALTTPQTAVQAGSPPKP
ncbi:MAG: hypothetical protein ACAH83_10250 [Alphaproteobacteria bacterium]